MRYIGVGILSYGLGVALAALFHEISGLNERIAVALSLAILLATNFTLARLFIFRSDARLRGQLVRFAFTSAAMRGTEYLIFLAMLNGLEINYLISLTAAMAISSALKFLLYRRFVFGNRGARP